MGQSRMTLGEKGTGKVGFDYQNEVLSAFRNCIIRATPAAKGTWNLEYDMIAAHALVCIVRVNEDAFLDATKRIDKRCRQAAEFLSDLPHSVHRFAGISFSGALQGLDKQALKVGGAMEGAVMDVLFRGIDESSPCILRELLEINAEPTVEASNTVYGIEVLESSSYSDLCKRCCAISQDDAEGDHEALKDAMRSAKAWVQLGRCPCRFVVLTIVLLSHEIVSAQTP